ncbi:MAG: peptidylprolyl isomerase FKBP-type [Chlorobi bacterium]|jgi:FKBP-type peptidyl-prolyl cis-trans isomerase FklB|nr:peptidylprolyl isomerase FKBP-type [Chlorobiota bacterium]
MKLLISSVLCLGFMSVAASAQQNVPLKTTVDSVSYSIGLDIGSNLKDQSIDVNVAALARGLNDAMGNGAKALSPQDIQRVMAAFKTEMQARQQALAAKAGDKNGKEGQDFLAKNKTRKGVITLPSGLQYEVLKNGTGATPKLTDKVKVHYTGTLIDGTVFDSSVERGQPLEIPVNGVIKGWTEALQLMKVGSKWKLFIPADLAYGPQGAGGKIGPNAALVFEVELLDVMPG